MDEREGFISASYLEGVADCNGKWNAEKNLPEPPSSPDATRGTLIHSALAGETLMLADDELEIYHQLMRKRDTLVDHHFPEGVDKVVKEQRYFMRDKTLGDYRFSGKPDYVGSKDGKFLVIDYKTGRGDVPESPDNLQLRALAVLVAETHKADVILVAIIQAFEQPQVVAYTKNDLREARDEVLRILQAAINPQARRTATAAACKYCRARPTCPEANAQLAEVAKVNGALIAVEDLPRLLELSRVATEIIKDIRGRAEELIAADPEAVDGWTLRNGNKLRSVKDAKAMRAGILELGLLSSAELDATKISPTELERMIARRAGVSPRAARVVIDKELGHLIETKDGKPRLIKK